ncbi:hypothetical protein RJ640_023160 [Escallonia rubra]|uniref:ALOG domain-containing protein n=1 Tax=Escallonia rubra TaxID=112253 RepID=A0AA88UIS0_9ASTE|nr:hypothetical protein RJ640_023160 [Escallonia rubra]
MFGQYLRNHRPPLSLARCSGAHVLEFLRYLNQFGHPSPPAKVHAYPCPFFGHHSSPAPCPCPLRQAWGSLDALIGRLCAAFEENEGKPESNPFGELPSDFTSAKSAIHSPKHGGISYEKKRRSPYYSSDLGCSFQEPFRSWRWLPERPDEPPQNPRFAVQSTGDQLREEEARPTLLLFRSRPFAIVHEIIQLIKMNISAKDFSVSPESITASAPSLTAMAMSDTSARVGVG